MTTQAHTPVMLREVIDALAPKDGGVYVDATFGAGGYTRAILAAADCTVYAFDRDPTAIARAESWAREFGARLCLINRPFGEMQEALADAGVEGVDGVVFDLGVSSMQLDEADRGFSFRHDGPLSMRMDGGKPDAADIIAAASGADLKAIFKVYGEEKNAAGIARAIVAARDETPIETTGALAAIVERASPPRGVVRIHPATRVFQALRIFVNDELGQLASGLAAAEKLLRAGGRLVVVAFHSLEDRIVKRFLQARASAAAPTSRHAPPPAETRPSFEVLHRRALAPREDEATENPRARSAKLRAGRRLDGPVRAMDAAALGLPTLSLSAGISARESAK